MSEYNVLKNGEGFYWCARDLGSSSSSSDGLFGNHHFVLLILNNKRTLFKSNMIYQDNTYFATFDATKSDYLRERINDSDNTKSIKENSLQAHKITELAPTKENVDLALQCFEYYYKNQEINNVPKYDVFDCNCATWVNTFYKVMGVSDNAREKYGEFSGTDWGEEDTFDTKYFKAKWSEKEYYSTIHCSKIDGTSSSELIARSAPGIQAWKYTNAGWNELPNGPAFSDVQCWKNPECYSTIQFADIDGDGRAELIARSDLCIVAWKYANGGWIELPNGPALSNDQAWNNPQYYSTIQCADIDGDGRAELIARSAFCIVAWKYDNGSWIDLPNGPALSDDQAWNNPQYYTTIQCADIDGDGKAELIARSAFCIVAWKYSDGKWNNLTDGPNLGD